MSRSAPSLVSATSSGSRLDALVALRDLLAAEIASCESARDVAALSQRLMDVLEQVEKLSAGSEAKGTPLDELRARRAARKTATPARRAPRKAE